MPYVVLGNNFAAGPGDLFDLELVALNTIMLLLPWITFGFPHAGDGQGRSEGHTSGADLAKGADRGFVPQKAPAMAPPDGPLRVSGLLRMSQPMGAFLRRNDPLAGRWFSRDNAANAANAADLGLAGSAFLFT